MLVSLFTHLSFWLVHLKEIRHQGLPVLHQFFQYDVQCASPHLSICGCLTVPTVISSL